MSSVPVGTLQPGQVLQGRYRILGILGTGGMGAVYQAADLRFAGVTRLCAVKEMINLAQDQELRMLALGSFEREAAILATLSHPAIPQIYDYFSFGNCAYLVQEFIQGRDLAALMSGIEGFLPTDRVCAWGIGLCDVLSYLHNYQPTPVIFRDMKPSNVMIDHLKNVRLIDFGIARTLQPNTEGTMVGTQGYAPPELYDGKADARSDIYSLGATLHHLLTRVDPQYRRPFSFDERPISSINPNVPETLAAVVMRALSMDPEQRYASAEAMKQSLIGAHMDLMPQPPGPVMGEHTRYHRNNGGSSISTNQPIAQSESSVEPIWVFLVEDRVRCRPLVYNGVVYFGSQDNNLWALSANDGILKWKFPTQGPANSSPTYAGGAVHIGSWDQRLYAVDARSGRLLWQFSTEGEIHSSPAAGAGLIFVGSDDGKLYAIKPAQSRGKKMWEFNAMSPIRSSPVVENDRLFVGLDSGELVCLDISGHELWRFTGRRRFLSRALIKDKMIFIGSWDRSFYALDVEHPLINWSFQTRGEITSSAAYGNHKVFFGSGDGNLYALDSRTGREVWRYKAGAPIISSPAIFNESVYFGAKSGMIYALHTESGDVLWQFQAGGSVYSSPAVADGAVYIGSDDHHLYALPA